MQSSELLCWLEKTARHVVILSSPAFKHSDPSVFRNFVTAFNHSFSVFSGRKLHYSNHIIRPISAVSLQLEIVFITAIHSVRGPNYVHISAISLQWEKASLHHSHIHFQFSVREVFITAINQSSVMENQTSVGETSVSAIGLSDSSERSLHLQHSISLSVTEKLQHSVSAISFSLSGYVGVHLSSVRS